MACNLERPAACTEEVASHCQPLCLSPRSGSSRNQAAHFLVVERPVLVRWLEVPVQALAVEAASAAADPS